MTGLRWEAPPVTALEKVRKTPYTDIAAALKENPGEWARLPDKGTAASAANVAQNIRRGKMKDFPAGQFEAVNDGAAVYVRYLGETAAAAPEPELDGQAEEANGAVRAWARANGFPDLPDRGRLPQEVRDAYARRTDG